MTEWKYPGDEAMRRAFMETLHEIIAEKNLTPEEVNRRIAEAHKTIDHRLHARAFGCAVRKLRQERELSRKALALAAGLPLRYLIRIERGHGLDVSVPEICRLACAFKMRPHELVRVYEKNVQEAKARQEESTKP